ncbi:MAG: class I adenylate-forming enzyme family protein [Duodenibacillus sp.]
MGNLLVDVLDIVQAAREAPVRTAVIDDSRRWSYAELAERVQSRAAALRRPAGGRPVYCTAQADFEGIVELLALLYARIPAVLLSPKLTEAERLVVRERLESIPEAPAPQTAFIVLTSGTTGVPKPVMLTRTALASGAVAAARALHMTSRDCFQLSLSPARVGGLGIVLRTLAVRGTIALAPKFDGARFVERLERDGVTLASLVPAMLADVLEKNPDWRNPKGLRALLLGGAALPDRLRRRAVERGIGIVTTYAMTETGSSVAVSAWERRFCPFGEGQVPLEGVRFRVFDGRLSLSGPMVFAGYWGRPSPLRNGWFETGDTGFLSSEGHVSVTARLHEISLTAGEKVAPVEVETVLESICGVREALVVGMPDEKWGEIVTALVVWEEGACRDAARLAWEAAKCLARYKCPRRLASVEAIPLTREGKRFRRPEVLQGLHFETLHYTR